MKIWQIVLLILISIFFVFYFFTLFGWLGFLSAILTISLFLIGKQVRYYGEDKLKLLFYALSIVAFLAPILYHFYRFIMVIIRH